MGIINLIFIWRSPKGRCYGNQLNQGAVRRRLHEGPLLFDNGFDDLEGVFKRLNGNDPATSCTNLVSFRLIISEFTLLKSATFATRPLFDDRYSFRTLAFRNGLVYRNLDFRIVISNHFCTSCRNLVRYTTVLCGQNLFRKFKLYVEKFFEVTSATFTRGRGC